MKNLCNYQANFSGIIIQTKIFVHALQHLACRVANSKHLKQILVVTLQTTSFIILFHFNAWGQGIILRSKFKWWFFCCFSILVRPYPTIMCVPTMFKGFHIFALEVPALWTSVYKWSFQGFTQNYTSLILIHYHPHNPVGDSELVVYFGTKRSTKWIFYLLTAVLIVTNWFKAFFNRPIRIDRQRVNEKGCLTSF